MREKIFKEALEWYEKQGQKQEVDIEDFVNLVIDKTADSIFDKVNDELKNEFEKGNLQQPFIISSDYYLDLKLKDIKQKCVDTTEEDELAEEQP
jgi:hypothetical protein